MFIRFALIWMFFALTLSVQSKETLTLALSSTPSNLSPFHSTDANSQNINRLIHLSLTDFSKSMTFECRLCTEYEERFEGDNHIIRFKLDPDAKFWDGTKVRAKDVEKSWKYFIEEEKIKSVFRFAFQDIQDVRIIDESTVELVYKKFSLENLSNLALLKIVKIPKYAEVDKVELEHIIGAGPYKLGEIKTLELELLPLGPERPRLDFKIVRDETTLALKLLNEEVDLSLANISPRKLNWLKKRAKELEFWSVDGATYNYLGLNHKSGFLSSLKVRKALAHLIPKKDLVEYKLKGTAKLATGLFSKAFTDYYIKDGLDKYSPEKAYEILKEEGFSRNENDIWEKDSQEFVLNWKVTNNKSTIELVEVIKNYLGKNGIKVNITIQEWGTFMRSVKNGDFDIVLSQWIGFTGPDMLRFVFHSESVPPKGGNRGYFIDPQTDKLLDQAANQRDEKKRVELFKKAAKRVNQQYAYINLWHPDMTWVGRGCLKLNEGVHSNGSFAPLLDITNECTKK